jgi:hypothetical protein
MSAIDRLAAADAAMTVGRWYTNEDKAEIDRLVWSGSDGLVVADLRATDGCVNTVENAEGIALLRNALPQIIEVLRAAQLHHNAGIPAHAWVAVPKENFNTLCAALAALEAALR